VKHPAAPGMVKGPQFEQGRSFETSFTAKQVQSKSDAIAGPEPETSSMFLIS
jgi:hypothetical protein